MNAPKFTPGPWRLDDDAFGSGIYVHNDDYHGVDAGRGYLDRDTMTGFNVCAHMSIADAALIAAAPDLFEACAHVERELTQYLDAMPADETSRALRDTLRAALAKAAP